MNRMMKNNIFQNMKLAISVLIFLAFAGTTMAQEDNTLEDQTIVIYNDYSPILKDASRIQSLPVIVDTVRVEPKFEYNVMPTMFKTSYKPSTITAATIKGETLESINRGFIKLGFGNYLSPYFDGYITSKRQKKYSVEAHVKHQSSWGNIKNSENQKIFSGYNNTLVETFGKRIFNASTLSGKINFSTDQYYFYGYDPYVLASGSVLPVEYYDTRKEFVGIDKTQRYNRLLANVRFESTKKALKFWDYLFEGNYQYFFTTRKDAQHKADLTANIGRVVKKIGYGVDVNFVYNNNKVGNAYKYNEIVLNANPYFKFSNGKWKILAGLNTAGELGNIEQCKADSVRFYHFYPNVYVHYNISNVFIPYFSFTGHLENNNLEYISNINPYVNNIGVFETTSYAQDINLGLKVHPGKKVYIHVNANYSKIDNMGFFVNDTTVNLKNEFVLQYSNVERVSAYAEIALRNIAPRLDINLHGHYYYYTYIKEFEHPWHSPSVDVCLRTNYRLNKNIKFGVEGNFESGCYVNELLSDGSYKRLKAVIDVNLFAEYSFTDKFSAYIYLNNIAGQRYYIWNNYRAQGFNLLAGIKYVF